jgi:hypothetical protein
MGNLKAIAPARLAMALLALLPAAHGAASAAAATLAGCRTLHDDAARLTCYDRLPDPETVAGPAARATAPVAAPAPATAEQRFGTSELQQARAAQAKAPKPEVLKELRARVDTVQRQGDGGLRLTLANGQVWYQVSPSEKIEVAVGEEIVIKPAAFGSFLLVDHDRHSARVHRAQ